MTSSFIVTYANLCKRLSRYCSVSLSLCTYFLCYYTILSSIRSYLTLNSSVWLYSFTESNFVGIILLIELIRSFCFYVLILQISVRVLISAQTPSTRDATLFQTVNKSFICAVISPGLNEWKCYLPYLVFAKRVVA